MLAPTKSRHTPMFDLFDQIRRTQLFSCLSGESAHRLAKRAVVRQLSDKATVTLPADGSRSVHLILHGKVKVCYLTRDGKQPILYFVDADELIGEQNLFRSSTDDCVETIEPTTIASFQAGELRDVMRQESEFASGIFELAAHRRNIAERRLRHILFLSNRERLVHLLLDLAEQFGTGTHDQVELTIKLSHQDLANFIGSTRETVTVLLGKLQADETVSVRRRRISLLDTKTLADSVERKLPSFLREQTS